MQNNNPVALPQILGNLGWSEGTMAIKKYYDKTCGTHARPNTEPQNNRFIQNIRNDFLTKVVALSW